MKILIITRSFVREVSELVKYVSRLEPSWKFHLVFPHDAHAEESLTASVSVRHIYSPRQIRSACYGPGLAADFLKFQPDIVQVFEEYSGILAFQSFLLSAMFVRRSKIMVYSAENITGNVRPELRMVMTYVMKRANLAFVCSQTVANTLLQEGFSQSIEVFPLGVNPVQFYKRSVSPLKQQLHFEGKFIIGYIGRLLRMKGVFMLIDMLPQLPDNVHVVFLGNGPEEQHLKEAATHASVERRVHLLGNILYFKLPDYISCMDIGLVPSQTTPRWKEQFGRSIIELMSCEVPVIGSDSGSIPEIVKDCGLIFQEGKLQTLISHILTLMESPEKRLEYGRRGRSLVLQHYSVEKMGDKFLNMYRRLSISS